MLKDRRNKAFHLMALAFVGLILMAASAIAQEKGTVSGPLDTIVKKFKTITVNTPGGPEVIGYTETTEIKNSDVKDVGDLAPGLALDVEYRLMDGKKVADAITVKLVKVDPADLITTEQVAGLVEKGPEQGNYLLVDCRPGKMFDEGHIPTAVSMHTDKWDELKDKVLPKDKDTQLIFYCAGVT
jgi:hypothetical protein